MDNPVSLKGGVVATDLPTVAPPPSAPSPVSVSGNVPGTSVPPPENFSGGPPMPPPPPPDTFVVPSAAPSGSNSSPPAPVNPAPGDNPFIPQVGAPENGATAVPQAPPAGPSSATGSAWLKRIIMIIVFLLLAVGAVFGVKQFILPVVTSNQEVTITYWGLWEDAAIVQGAIADFQKQNPKIKVSYVKQSQRQYRERLQAAITRGDGPDVFRFHNTWLPMLKNEVAVAPKEIMTATEFANTFYPIAASNLVAGQSIYGFPLEIDGLGLFYNEDLFAAAGLTPPATWEDVLNLVPKLTVKNDTTITTSAIALGTASNVEHFSDILATMMLQNGANLVDPSGKEAEETLIFYRKFSNPSDPVYTWNDTLDNSINAFANSKVAMIMAPSWRAFDIKQMNPDLHFKIAPIPQLPGNSVTWASYWVEGVSTKSKNQLQAWKFVKYLTSREGATKLYTEEAKIRLFGEPYARVDLADSLTQDPYVGAYVQQAKNAKTFPLASRTFDNGLNDKLIQYLTDAVNGVAQGSSPVAVLQTMSAGFRQILSQYGLVSSNPPAATQ